MIGGAAGGWWVHSPPVIIIVGVWGVPTTEARTDSHPAKAIDKHYST